ncbi:hypothetical protein [Phaeospirillum tilakii]|uniref:Uncharacterized protein n=1 Tax=Phaeospirillum tilakii TaxID=741673 RepID=A0ABW5CB36_9PROT
MPTDRRHRRLIRLIQTVVVLVSTVWPVGLSVWPRPGQAMAAVFPPGASGNAALFAAWQAGAEQVMAFGGWPWVVLVRSDAPDFVGQLHHAGAWLVLRVPAAGAICAADTPSRSPLTRFP